jgi:transcriptional repressor NrdR
VAYLRFASVYRSFESLEDFEREIATLRDAAINRIEATRAEKNGSAEKIGATPKA